MQKKNRWAGLCIAVAVLIAAMTTGVAASGSTEEAPTLFISGSWGDVNTPYSFTAINTAGEPRYGSAIWNPQQGHTYVDIGICEALNLRPWDVADYTAPESGLTSAVIVTTIGGMQVILEKLDDPDDLGKTYVRADQLFQATNLSVVWSEQNPFEITIYDDPPNLVLPSVPYKGDLDDDGYVTAQDVGILGTTLSGPPEWGEPFMSDAEKWVADYNSDGFIDRNDYIGILNRAAQAPWLRQTVSNPEKGDVSADGRISGFDEQLIWDHISGAKMLTPEQVVLADYDLDGEITSIDSILINSIHDSVAFNGDINLDGIFDTADIQIVQSYIDGEYEFDDEISSSKADMNKNGVIDHNDVELMELILEYGKPYPAGPISPPPAFLLGDVDGDGVITEADVTLLRRYLVRETTLSDEQLLAADHYEDGIVDIFDAASIQSAIPSPTPEPTPQASPPSGYEDRQR